MLTRRTIVQGLSAAALLPGIARAEDAWPDRPIRMIVPVPPGGTGDILSRLIAQQLTPVLKQNFVIENRAGAGGSVGAADVARAAPDGYTFLLSPSNVMSFDPWLYKEAGFDPVKSFTPIAYLAAVPNMLVVNPKLPVKNVAELVAYAKANPGKLNYSSAGVGSAAHVSMAYFAFTTGIDVTHIPYRGTAASVTDLVAGRVQLTITGALPVLPFVKGNQLRALGICSLERAPFAADVPTIAESGYPGFEAVQWSGICGPVGTPAPIVKKFHDAISDTMTQSTMVENLKTQGATYAPMTTEAFGDLIKRDVVRWGEVIKKAGITA